MTERDVIGTPAAKLFGLTVPRAATLDDMDQPQASVDWLGLALGFAGTVGALIAVFEGSWLWATVIFLASIIAELLVALVRRRRARQTIGS